jgi:integrase
VICPGQCEENKKSHGSREKIAEPPCPHRKVVMPRYGHSEEETARAIVKKDGNLVGVKLRPHDLRRHAATHASRSGVPEEISSKAILRHANLSTTQRYLAKVSDTEAIRWIDNLYA